MIEGLESEAEPPRALKARVMSSLEREGKLRGPRRRLPMTARVAAAVLLFTAGVLAGRLIGTPPGASEVSGARYLLVLYEDESFRAERAEDDLVAEYGAWAATPRTGGTVTMGEQLGPGAWLIDGTSADPFALVPGPYGRVAGFFVITAEDPATALSIARTCPHLSYGGRISVQPILRT